ncbi:MAG: hypothetical protein AAB393_17510, partial [Bacteroidota bacterium]
MPTFVAMKLMSLTRINHHHPNKGQSMIRYVQLLVVLLLIPLSTRSQEDSTSHVNMEELRDEVSGISESVTEIKNIVDALKKIRVSGYVQAQYRYTDLVNQQFAIGNFSGGQFPANAKNLFQVRRGRFKLTYDNTLTQCVFEIDIVPTGVSMRDAYLSLTEPWLQSFGLQMGAFYVPFGYEVSFTSGSRESPELS